MRPDIGPTVLVVDDDLVLLEGLGDALTAAGYHALLAADGAAALTEVRRHRPDVIVSDIVMPGMDGCSLLRAVRRMPGLAAVPFIFLSARGERAEVRSGMDLGADDYVTKPFRAEELLQAIGSRLDRQRVIELERPPEDSDWVQQLATALHHELRTPLAQVSAYAELLASAGSPLQAEDFHATAVGLEQGVSRLGRLAADFLMLADLRLGRAREDYEARRATIHDWPALVAAAVARHEHAARQRGVVFAVSCADHAPPVHGDGVFLVDALGRLLDNAVKFSPPGGEVRVQVSPRDGALAIDVWDQGPGIDESRLEALLQPLRQVDRQRHEQQGLGNGLAICSGLVRLHGGEIHGARGDDGGSRFTIVLPTLEAAGRGTRT